MCLVLMSYHMCALLATHPTRSSIYPLWYMACVLWVMLVTDGSYTLWDHLVFILPLSIQIICLFPTPSPQWPFTPIYMPVMRVCMAPVQILFHIVSQWEDHSERWADWRPKLFSPWWSNCPCTFRQLHNIYVSIDSLLIVSSARWQWTFLQLFSLIWCFSSSFLVPTSIISWHSFL